MLVWLLVPTARCSFRAFRDTPLDEVQPGQRIDPGQADQHRVDEGRGFFSGFGGRVKACYEATPLFGQEDWKGNLLVVLAGATVLLWAIARIEERGKRTLT